MYTIFRFPGGVAKMWGKFGIIILWRKIFVLKIGPELMAVVDELFRRKQSKDPQAGNGKLSLEDWRCGGSSTSSQGEWNIVSTGKEYAQNVTCYLSPSPVFLTSDSLAPDHDLKNLSRPVIPKCYKKKFWIPGWWFWLRPLSVICLSALLARLWWTSPHHLNMYS